MQNGAQLKCLLGEKQINRPHFNILGVEPTACPETAESGERLDVGPVVTTQRFPQMDRNELKLAKDCAAAFVRKFNPSGYGEEIGQAPTNGIYEQAPLIAVARSTLDTPATLCRTLVAYLMQRISWHEETSWKQTFDEHQVSSPAPKRSEDEWNLFLQCLKNDPDFSEILTSTELVTCQEMPFFWRMDDTDVWKELSILPSSIRTKRNGISSIGKRTGLRRTRSSVLQGNSRPQMAAYWQAIRSLTNALVSAAIYSTATGQFIAYDRDELTREWERLCDLPQDGLVAPISSRVRRG